MELRERWCLALAELVALGDPGLATRDELIAWTREQLRGGAWELAHVIATWRWAAGAHVASDDDAHHVILLAGKLAQTAYRSWEDFAAACERGGGEVSDAARASWRDLPWNTELGVTLVEPVAATPRVLEASCVTCGAPRVRPSPSLYAYCDFCGALMDADYTVARDARVGPAYEALHAQARAQLEQARVHGDEHAYDDLVRALYEQLFAAVPEAAPARAKDPEYRARYAAYMAACETRAVFDERCRAAEDAMRAAVERLVFVDVDGRARVASEPFRVLADAYFAYEATRDAHLAELYARHPDAASRELQRRIGHSLFVQGWLPYLAEIDARALLDRAGLSHSYRELAPPELRATSCGHCGAPLAIVAGAKRVVCAHCGRLADVTSPRVA